MAREFFVHYLVEEIDGQLGPGDDQKIQLLHLQPKPIVCPDHSFFQVTPSDSSLTINLQASIDIHGRIIVPRTNFRTLKSIIIRNRRQVNLDTPLMLQPDSDPLIYYRGPVNDEGQRKVVLVSNFDPPKILRIRPAR